MNHSTVEEGEVSGLKPDPVIFDPVLSRVSVERPGFQVGLDLGGPEASVDEGLWASVLSQSVLKAEDPGKLVLEPGNRIVEEPFPQGDVIDVRSVCVSFIVDAKDGGSIKASVGLAGNFDLLAAGQA